MIARCPASIATARSVMSFVSMPSRSNRQADSLSNNPTGLLCLPAAEAQSFMRRLRLARAKLGSWGAVAKKAGVSPRTVLNWRKNINTIRIREARKCFEAFGMRPTGSCFNLHHAPRAKADLHYMFIRRLGRNKAPDRRQHFGALVVGLQSRLLTEGVTCAAMIMLANKKSRALLEYQSPTGRRAIEIELTGDDAVYRLLKGEPPVEIVAGLGPLNAEGADFCSEFIHHRETAGGGFNNDAQRAISRQMKDLYG